MFTVGTKIIADPEMFPGINLESFSEKVLILLWDRPCLESNIASSNFRLGLAAGQMTGISLKAIDSSRNVLKITGPALSRFNSVIISAWTVQFVNRQTLATEFCTLRYRPSQDPHR